LEPRQLCYKIVDELRKKDPASKPCIIIYFAPPYCPHNYLKEDNEEILHKLQTAAKDWEEKLDEKFELKRFFPYLSDSSYLSLHDTEEEIAALIENFPEWEKIYPVPVNQIKKLNIPAINIGVYGLDAHSWKERVYKPYSFEKLPLMIQDVIFTLLK
jgi:arginine utilization protein RocB